MKLFPAAAAVVALAVSSTSALAEPLLDVLLDFETVTGYVSIGDFYNGGFDGAGATGTNYGISFTGGAFGLVNDGTGTGANGEFFTNAPSPVGVLAPVDLDATLNIASGFDTGLQFAYSAAADVLGGVQVWSGLNGTGTLLASLDLSANATAGCTGSDYCNFDYVGIAFSGVAHSVTFGNAAGSAFDNVQIGAVPEPSSIALMVLGAAALAAAARRRA